MEVTINSILELEEFARSFLVSLPGNEKWATVVGLSGELGSGKTAFTQALARALSVSAHILSPTFVLAKYYPIPGHQHFSRLIHMDLYRIRDKGELRTLRLSELFRDPRNLMVIEWPEKLGEHFPPYGEMLCFDVVDETTRRLRRAPK